jgi:hypothetical protein
MASATTLNSVLQFLDTCTDSIHPAHLTTKLTKPIMDRMSELEWTVHSSLLFPGDFEVPLSVSGVDDVIESWDFDDKRGRDLDDLIHAVEVAWEKFEMLDKEMADA